MTSVLAYLYLLKNSSGILTAITLNPHVSLRGPGDLIAVSPAVREHDGSTSEHFLFSKKDACKGLM